jgi:hypothetical protein
MVRFINSLIPSFQTEGKCKYYAAELLLSYPSILQGQCDIPDVRSGTVLLKADWIGMPRPVNHDVN